MNSTRVVLSRQGFTLWTSLLILSLILGLVWIPGSLAYADNPNPDRNPTYVQGHGTASAAELAAAIDIPDSLIVSASLNGSDAAGSNVFSTPVTGFPTKGGTFAAISSGNVAQATLPNDTGSLSTQLGGLNNSQGNDLFQLVLALNVPPGATAWEVDWKFLSEEYPEWVGSAFNDVFLMETPSSNFSISGNTVTAPNNVAFDANHQLITINTTGSLGMSLDQAAGTTYDGATATLVTHVPIPAGTSQITIIFSVMDLGDSVYDSTAFLDNFRFINTLTKEPISNFGTCGPVGPKTPTWGQFGTKSTLEFDSGDKLEVECGMISSNLAAFLLWYTSPQGTRNRIGTCPFEAGCNSAWFIHAGDTDNNGKPDQLIRTQWISRDYGQNDLPNAWTGSATENPPVLDWAESVFDSASQMLTKTDYAYAYNVPPPILNSCTLNPNPKPEGDLIATVVVDPPIGPETEVFFDSVLQLLANAPAPIGPMEELTLSPCDLDANGQCDSADLALLQQALGNSRGDPGYNPLADADVDGIVTAVDQEIYFPTTSPGENNPPDVTAGGPFVVNEGSSAIVTAQGSDPDGDLLSYAWDLNNDGIFETPGQSVTFSAAQIDGPSDYLVEVQVTDTGGLSNIDQTTISVLNVAPIVSTPSVSPEPSILGATVIASATFLDPAPDDAPFACIIDYGDGSGDLPGTVTGNTCTGPSHAYTAVGLHTVTVRVTDKDSETGTRSVAHSVIYNFNGYYMPVDNLPTLNQVKAGSAVPVKFSLGGNQGLSIFAAGFPVSVQMVCDTTEPLDAIEETVTAGGSSLSYDASTNMYIYVWKTNKAWAGTCRQLVVKLRDGTDYQANFKFTK